MPNKNKILLQDLPKMILVLSLIAGIGAVMGIMFYALKNRPIYITDSKNYSILDQGPETKNEMTDWKTYRNEAYGYELKYPAIWDVQEGLSNNKMDFISSGSIILSIGVFPERISEVTDCTDYPADEGQCEEVIIDGQKKAIESDDLEIVNIKYPFGGMVNIASKSIKTENKKIFRNILSTFKMDKNTGWKTYRSEKYGFELQYPRSLILSENDDYDGDNDQIPDKELLTLNKISNNIFLTINRFEIGKNETYKDAITDNSWLPGGGTGRADFSKFKLVKIGDNPCYYRYFCGDPSGSVEDGTSACGFCYYYWLVNGQDVYEFELSETLSTDIKKPELENYENTPSHQEMKDILSAFKFIEKDETLNLKTYRNEDYGFELKYPQNFEVLVNNPNGKKNPSFRDKKYADSYEWSGLDIDWMPISIETEIPKKESTFFSIENTKNGIISIYFTNEGERPVIAACKIYQDTEILTICNQIISSFKYENYISWIPYEPEHIKNIINSIVGSKNIVKYAIRDLDSDGNLEIIISEGDYENSVYNAYVAEISEKDYHLIGKIKMPSVSGGWLIGKTIDINNDGIREVFLEPEMRGGTSGEHFYTIASINFETPKLELIKAMDSVGNAIDIFEYFGGSDAGRCDYSGWVFGKDFDNDGKKEIFRLDASTSQDSSLCGINPKIEDNGLCKNCELVAFEWNGLNFEHNETISRFAKENINTEDFQGSGCDRCVWK